MPPRRARMALKDYSDNEAVRSRGQGLVSTFPSKKKMEPNFLWIGWLGFYVVRRFQYYYYVYVFQHNRIRKIAKKNVPGMPLVMEKRL